MNLIETFQELVAQVPALVQPLIIALAGAVPFIEGEGAVTIGVLGGMHPVIAAVAAIAGNFLCVALLVLLSSGARSAVLKRHRAKTPAVGGEAPVAEDVVVDESARAASRREKFTRSLDRYGVPGVSLLGPLLLPTMFTATMLAAVGVTKARILFWQALAIVGWTTLLAVLMSGLVNAVS